MGMASIFRTLGARNAGAQNNERENSASAISATNHFDTGAPPAEGAPPPSVDALNPDAGKPGRTARISTSAIIKKLEYVASARKEDNEAEVVADFSSREIIGFDFSEYAETQDDMDILTGANFEGAIIIGCRFGPKISGLRAQDREVPLSKWTNKRSCNLEGANFEKAAIFWSLFTGIRLSNATFDEAEIYHTTFDLAYLSDDFVWSGVSFCQARIEKTTFRGVQINADFSDTRMLYCDFTPAFLPSGDWKKNTDPRLTSAISIQLRFSTPDFRKVLKDKRAETKKLEDEKRISTNDFTTLKNIIDTLEKYVDDFSFLLRNMTPARLGGGNFENALLYECEFRSAQLTPFVNFDLSKIFKSDFVPARVENIPVRSMIEDQLHQRLNSADSDEMSQLRTSHQFRLVDRLIRQIADNLENLDSTTLDAVSGDTKFEKAIVPTKLVGSSFEEAIISETRLTNADLQKSEFNEAMLTDVSAENVDFSNCNLKQSVFYKTNGDGGIFNGSNCTQVRFDGNLRDGEKTQKIESFATQATEIRENEKEHFKRREKEISKLRKSVRKVLKNLGIYYNDEAPSVEEDDYGMNEPSISDSDASLIVYDSNISADKKRELFNLYRLEHLHRRNAYTNLATYYSELDSEIDEEHAGVERAGEQASYATQGSCSFIGGSFVNIRTERGGLSFQSCSLEATNFTGASLGSQGGGLGANFDLAFLRAASFSDADLERASFSGATLTGVSGLGSGTNLEGASFLGTQGLTGKEFAEADLSNAILPEDLKRFGGVLASVEQLTRQARILFATLMLACAYSVMTLVNFNIAAPESIAAFKLPVVGVEVSKSIFYFATPLLIFSFFVMFHLKFSRIWMEAKSLPRQFPDGRGVDRHLFPWIFASLVPAQIRSNRRGFDGKEHAQHSKKKKSTQSAGKIERATQWFEGGLAYIFGWWVAPLTMLFFIWRQNLEFSGSDAMITIFGLDFTGDTVLLFTYGLFFVALGIVALETRQLFTSLSWARPKGGGQGDKEKGLLSLIRRFVADLTDRFRGAIDRVTQIFGVTTLTIGIFAMGVFFSLGPKGLQSVAISAPTTFGDDVGTTISTFAVKLGRALYEVDARDFKTHSLRGDDFSHADIAFLELTNVDLRGEDFSEASLFNAQFDTLDLQDADFRQANLTRVKFGGSNLEGVNFDGAILAGADLSKVSNLATEQLLTACGDAHTQLPPEVAPLKPCRP